MQMFSILGSPSPREVQDMQLDKVPSRSLAPLGSVHGCGLEAYLKRRQAAEHRHEDGHGHQRTHARALLQTRLDTEALSIIRALLQYSPVDRLSISAALEHPYVAHLQQRRRLLTQEKKLQPMSAGKRKSAFISRS